MTAIRRMFGALEFDRLIAPWPAVFDRSSFCALGLDLGTARVDG
ncbi:MAG: hypothetical protein ACO3WU_02685 [Ilumatobacteraceae bacterium]